MSGARVAGLTVFPLKSGRGVDLSLARLEARGIAQDRRWMLTDTGGRFLSQRELPRLARLHARAEAEALILEAEGLPRIVARPTTACTAEIWRDEVTALGGDDAADAALSAWLGRDVRLVRQDADARRPVALAPDVDASLADGYPYLIASASSLADLNGRLRAPVPMDRFRPNLVVAGAPPWAEDGWRRLRIGDAVLECLKPCARCVVVTTDQDDGERRGPEPLRTLASFRSGDEGGVLFGMNAVLREGGEVRLGDPVVPLP